MRYIIEKDLSRPDIDDVRTLANAFNAAFSIRMKLDEPITLPPWIDIAIWYRYAFERGYLLNTYYDEALLMQNYIPLTNTFIHDMIK